MKITDQIVSCIFYGFSLFTDFSETWCEFVSKDGSMYTQYYYCILII